MEYVEATMAALEGLGVFGAVGYTPDELGVGRRWIDGLIDGKPRPVAPVVQEFLLASE